MREYDDAVLECFLDKQLQLFPEAVAETLDEAEDFLEECMARSEEHSLNSSHREKSRMPSSA